MNTIHLVGTQRKATEGAAGKYVYDFFLAAVSDHYSETADPDAFEFTAENGYDTFANLTADEPEKKVKRPLTVMRDAKTVLASLFASIVSVVNETGRLPAANVKDHLANAKARDVDPVRFMIFVAEALWPKITVGNLDRDFDSVACFRTKVEALVQNKAFVEGGSEELARIYVRFLKCVAWAAANFAVEHKVTLNGWFLRGIFRNFGALPDAGVDEGLLEFFDDQLEWVERVDTVKKGAAKAAPAKAAAPKAAAPAPAAEPAAAEAPAEDEDGKAPAEEPPADAAAPPAETAADQPPPKPKPAAKTAAAKTAAAAPAPTGDGAGGTAFSYDDLMSDLGSL